MANYRLSEVAKEDLIRIYLYGLEQFGEIQAEKYYNSFFDYFDTICQRPLSFEAIDFIRPGYHRCVCGSDTIYFRFHHDMVEIMTIIGRQDLTNL